MKEKIEGVEEAYHKKQMESKDDRELHTYRWRLMDKQEIDAKAIAKLHQKIEVIKRGRIQRGHWIAQADRRARECLEKLMRK